MQKRGLRLKTIRQLEKMKKPKGTGYPAGTVIEMTDGTTYTVTEHGNWVKHK